MQLVGCFLGFEVGFGFGSHLRLPSPSSSSGLRYKEVKTIAFVPELAFLSNLKSA